MREPKRRLTLDAEDKCPKRLLIREAYGVRELALHLTRIFDGRIRSSSVRSATVIHVFPRCEWDLFLHSENSCQALLAAPIHPASAPVAARRIGRSRWTFDQIWPRVEAMKW